MSYTITQQATSPNAAYTRLLYAVSGSIYTTQPQFQYVMDVYESGSSNLIKRTTQTINPAGVAIFDPSRIIQGQLSVDYNWKINTPTEFNSSSKEFIIEFGEQFGVSISSSVTVYPTIASSSIETFQGVVEPNAGYYNWDSASYAVLSNMPATMSMQTNDYGTVSLYNNTVVYVSQSFYSASVSGSLLVENKSYTVTDNFSSIPISSSANYWNYVDVNVSSSVGLESYRYEVSDDTCREKTRFAFINKLGAWDYYNNYNPVRQVIDVKREQYTAPRVDYSSLTSTYDISRRGRTDVHNSTDDMFTVDTDLLDKTNANWLEELIESPEVYIQRNGEFIPIVITDSSYVANQNQARQKLFKYTINFKPSNQPFGTWIPEYVSSPLPPSQPQPFDPTLGGTLTNKLYVWYDFTNTGSMTMSGNTPTQIASKGLYTGSLVSGSGNMEYVSDGYTIVSGATGNDYNYRTVGDTLGIEAYNSGSDFTIITVASADNSNPVNACRIDFSGDSNGVVEQYIATRLYEYRNNGSAPVSSSQIEVAYLSNTKVNNGISSSFSFVTTPFVLTPYQHNAGYNYSGSNTDAELWDTRFIKYTHATSTYVLGRKTSETYTGIGAIQTNSDANNGFNILAEQDASIKLSQILVYSGSLSNTQIDQITNNLKQSEGINYGNLINAVNN